MKVIGKNWTVRKEGGTATTLHVAEDFDAYYSDSGAGRFCKGQRVSSIYVGDYDCTKIEIGTEIEIFYGKAAKTKDGAIYQPVKRIQVIGKEIK